MRRILVWMTLIMLWAGSSWASVTANSIVTTQTPTRLIASLGPTAACTGSGLPFTCCTGNGAGCVAGTYYTLYTAGANGSKCNSLVISNTDGSATHLLTIDLNDGTVDHKVTSITTVSPPGASTSNVGTVSAIGGVQWPLPVDSDANPYFQMQTGDILKWTFATAITASTEIDAFGNCANF